MQAIFNDKNTLDHILGTKLINMGLSGKKIAIIGDNRYEWCLFRNRYCLPCYINYLHR